MRVADGVDMLEISAPVLGKMDLIYPTVIWDEETAILVDTGYPGQLPKLRKGMEKAGLSPDRLKQIILTHQDLDHIGSLPDILHQSPRVKVWAHPLEKPYIQGEKRLLKITPEVLARVDSTLPAEVPREWRQAFKAILENPPKGEVDRTLEDGEVLPFCGGITVIHTPGHTPGHISLYHQRSKTLIAGDALVLRAGRLAPPDPHQTLDMDLAIQSLQKLTRYEIERVICYHGGLCREDPNRQIAKWAGS